MKANPGGPITGEAIIGREIEIADIWDTLEKRSVLLTSERRVGKTCILRKMSEHPKKEWVPVSCWVESARHPVDLVERLYSEEQTTKVLSTKKIWSGRFRKMYQKLAGGSFGGWQLPPVRADWKHLFRLLVEDITQNSEHRVLIMLDEFPMMVWNVVDDHGGSLGMELLDALREFRAQFEPTGKIRFLLSGSIGLHLVVRHLKADHGYKGSPTNDMDHKILSGMTAEDTELMCQKYLDEEGIKRSDAAEFSRRMHQSTDGLPLYIQYVANEFQERRRKEVRPEEIDPVLREMMDNPAVPWLRDAAERLDTYYTKLQASGPASAILKFLSHTEHSIAEEAILDFVRSQMVVVRDETLLPVLELLWRDNYLSREISNGKRCYRFRYSLVRKWWEINRG